MFERPPLSLALTGLAGATGVPADPRAAIQWAASLGYTAVQVDATQPGLRPRELDRSARRDLASLLRRCELTLTGLDLFIPPAHFIDSAHVDRALAATLQSLDLLTELRALVPGSGDCVSLTLPPEMSGDACIELATAAERSGVLLADFTIDTPYESRPRAIGVGLDPAATLLASKDPVQRAAHLGARLFAARFSDAASGVRVEPNSPGGELDLTAYAAALSVIGYDRPLIADLRGLPRPAESASSILSNNAD